MNVNTGICHRRIQEGKAPYFVNWQNHYAFFSFPWQMEICKERLKGDDGALWSEAYLNAKAQNHGI